MAALQSRFGPVLLWIAAFAALAAIIGWETDWGRHVAIEPETPSAKAQPVTVALLPDYAIEGGAAARTETVERPAFVPTRRPAPPPPQPGPPKPTMQRGQFVLTGTAIVDKHAIAFLREAATGKSRTVRKGDTINGLTVTEVQPDRVTLAMGDETEGIALKVAAGPRQTIQPVQPGVAGAAVPPGAAPRPVVPGQPPVAAAGAQAKPNVPAVDTSAQSLLERRRAARAAQAAAEAAARANQPAAGTTPASPQAPAGVDPGWAEVYRRMQQPRQ